MLTSIKPLLLLSLLGTASACSCAPLSLQESLDMSQMVAEISVRGEITTSSDPTDDPFSNEDRFFRAKLDKVYKGCLDDGATIIVRTGGNSAMCGLGLKAYQKELLVGSLRKEFVPRYNREVQVLSVGLCDNLRTLDSLSEEDQAILDSVTTPSCENNEKQCSEESCGFPDVPNTCPDDISIALGPCNYNEALGQCVRDDIDCPTCSEDSDCDYGDADQLVCEGNLCTAKCRTSACAGIDFGEPKECPDGFSIVGNTGRCIYDDETASCDWEMGRCPGCSSADDCSDNQTCSDGFCTKREPISSKECDDSECSPADECPDNGVLVSSGPCEYDSELDMCMRAVECIPCLGDDECGVGLQCDNGSCVPKSMQACVDSDCSPPDICSNNELRLASGPCEYDESMGMCTRFKIDCPPCTEDIECGDSDSGLYCELGECVPSRSCTTSDDCFIDGQTCMDGVCVKQDPASSTTCTEFDCDAVTFCSDGQPAEGPCLYDSDMYKCARSPIECPFNGCSVDADCGDDGLHHCNSDYHCVVIEPPHPCGDLEAPSPTLCPDGHSMMEPTGMCVHNDAHDTYEWEMTACPSCSTHDECDSGYMCEDGHCAHSGGGDGGGDGGNSLVCDESADCGPKPKPLSIRIHCPDRVTIAGSVGGCSYDDAQGMCAWKMAVCPACSGNGDCTSEQICDRDGLCRAL